MSHRTRRVLALLGGVALALLGGAAVLAQGEGPADKVLAAEVVLVPAGTTIDHDLYAFGSTVTIAGTVNGDLVAGAARVVIDGTVTGDVFAAGSELVVNGTVGGDLRSAAGQVTIAGSVTEDAAIAASSLLLETAGRVGQDVLFTATKVVLDGNVAGGISGTATDYERHGTVGGTEQVTLGTRVDQPAIDRTLSLALDAVRQYVVVMLFGLALLRFAPKLFRASVERVRSQPLVAAGVGVVVLIGYAATLIMLVVLMVIVTIVFGQLEFGGFVAIDIIGTLLAAFGLTFGLVVFSTYVADAIVGLAIGRLVSIADTSRWADVIRLAIGVALVVLVTSFPEVGGIVKLLVILVGLGAFSYAIREGRRHATVVMPLPPPAAAA